MPTLDIYALANSIRRYIAEEFDVFSRVEKYVGNRLRCRET